jgi:hypothetical protein
VTRPDELPDATRGRDRRDGPDGRALAILLLGVLAIVATSAPIPSVEARTIGEVTIGPGETAQRDLRIHVAPEAGGATTGTIALDFQSASGLQTGYAPGASLSLGAASDAAGPFPPSPTFPLERCLQGCDLTYHVDITGGPAVLPGSIARYTVEVRLQYANGSSAPPSDTLRLDLDGAASGPVAPTWAVVAGLLALVLGVLAGPAIDRRLSARRRRWPGYLAIALALVAIGWSMIAGLTAIIGAGYLGAILQWPSVLYAFGDPWSIALVLTLVLGLWRGVQRWPIDGGWLLGVAAVALVAIGGLWWTWSWTLDAVIQPVLLGASLAVLAVVGGVVIGQAWRTDPRARHDRWWAAVAVVAHGMIVAGFGFIALATLPDQSSSSPLSFLLLIPAALVAIAFGRWLYGGQRWLILFDVLVAGTGLLGALAWGSLSGISSSQAGLAGDDAGVALAVVAALVALATSLHQMAPRAGSGGEVPRPDAAPPATQPLPTVPASLGAPPAPAAPIVPPALDPPAS